MGTALAPVNVRLLAFLHTHQRDNGRPTSVVFSVPTEGMLAVEIARTLDLPLEMVEGLFLNGTLVGLGARVHPGDRAAFLPYGTPASHPAFFSRTGIEASAISEL